jgi:hypothetical protein
VRRRPRVARRVTGSETNGDQRSLLLRTRSGAEQPRNDARPGTAASRSPRAVDLSSSPGAPARPRRVGAAGRHFRVDSPAGRPGCRALGSNQDWCSRAPSWSAWERPGLVPSDALLPARVLRSQVIRAITTAACAGRRLRKPGTAGQDARISAETEASPIGRLRLRR